jgi:hypothetical protein
MASDEKPKIGDSTRIHDSDKISRATEMGTHAWPMALVPLVHIRVKAHEDYGPR